MFNPHENPGDLKALQDDIYRDRVLRARSQTQEERLADVFALSNAVFTRMHDGVMSQFGLTEANEGWRRVRNRLERLQIMHDRGRFVSENKSPHAA